MAFQSKSRNRRFQAILSVTAAILGIASAPAVDRVGSTPPANDSEPQKTNIDEHVRTRVLELLARELQSRYAIADTGKHLARALRAKQRAHAYRTLRTGPDFARAVTEDMFGIAHDRHLRLDFTWRPFALPAPGAPPSKEVLDQMRRENGAIARLEILDGNVGYMRVNGVPLLEAARDAMAASFAFLHHTDALIIDCRENHGGDPNTVALYVSYLSEGAPFIVNTFHWREGDRIEEFRSTDLGELSYGSGKPVFVLTSSATFSGDLQVSKRAVIVGETTGGGANPGAPVALGDHFVAFLPDGQGINPITGTSWEGVGVRPDIPVESRDALMRAHAAAIGHLRASASDTDRQLMLDAVSMKLQSIEEADTGRAVRLAVTELEGDYVPERVNGTTVTVKQKDGQLLRHIQGLPDRVLINIKGNRYRPEGLPDGFAVVFRRSDARVELLLEEPAGVSVIRVRR
jgi:retinol-binding protein 3